MGPEKETFYPPHEPNTKHAAQPGCPLGHAWRTHLASLCLELLWLGDDQRMAYHRLIHQPNLMMFPKDNRLISRIFRAEMEYDEVQKFFNEKNTFKGFLYLTLMQSSIHLR